MPKAPQARVIPQVYESMFSEQACDAVISLALSDMVRCLQWSSSLVR